MEAQLPLYARKCGNFAHGAVARCGLQRPECCAVAGRSRGISTRRRVLSVGETAQRPAAALLTLVAFAVRWGRWLLLPFLGNRAIPNADSCTARTATTGSAARSSGPRTVLGPRTRRSPPGTPRSRGRPAEPARGRVGALGTIEPIEEAMSHTSSFGDCVSGPTGAVRTPWRVFLAAGEKGTAARFAGSAVRGVPAGWSGLAGIPASAEGEPRQPGPGPFGPLPPGPRRRR